ncbi:hypothetical protein [Pengzhenrongella sicca]|uniref:Secreted protein n=1 Tax=Pengzhenrongella sicca TaxID=2819238 RepID=A0A8A4ZER6_9MICO|nr:hypothetical protein [Pengzhenrongella sicca]QTE30470.1 hypothetical protein J4E96_05670 [Pengzhenrongella sicca]
MHTRNKFISTIALAGILSMSLSGVANAAPEPVPDSTVVSEAGITAMQIAPAGATGSQIEQAIQAFEIRDSAATASASPLVANGTGDYYSYCEEGSSGLMVWTNNSPSNCYGWFYEYLDGSRLSKVNMLQLKVAGQTGPNPADLVEWCDANGTACMVVVWIAGGVGNYLRALIFG